MVYWRKVNAPYGPRDTSKSLFHTDLFSRWYWAAKSDLSWPKMGFSVRNGRTCVTPQALASTKINVLRTNLNNYSTINWLKTSKSASQSQNWILGTQNLDLAHRDLKVFRVQDV